jgi:hypothetical protein
MLSKDVVSLIIENHYCCSLPGILVMMIRGKTMGKIGNSVLLNRQYRQYRQYRQSKD